MYDHETDHTPTSLASSPKRSKSALLIAATLATAVFGGLFFLFAGDEDTTESPVAQVETTEPTPTIAKAEPKPAMPETDRMLFDYDSSLLSGAARTELFAWVTYLQGQTGMSVQLEGHCDERGSRSYNQSLGLERAESIKAFLVENGIAASRIRTISYGEDQPLRHGSGEENWRHNRRVKIRTLDANLSQN